MTPICKWRRRTTSTICLFLIAFLLTGLSDYTEYEIKAGLLEKFTRFVEWPESKKSQPFVVCVIGRSPFEQHLDELAKVSLFNERRATVRYAGSLEEIGEPDLLFICRSESRDLEKILQAVEGRPVLTVSDSKGFSQRGVLINLYESEGYIRYEINQTVMAASSLRLSAKLMKTARIVKAVKK